jgi:MFS family permease
VLDVTFPAFARTHGSAAVAGILLSAFAVGSWIGGFIYGLRPPAGSAARQYPRWCLLAALGLAPLILRPSLGIMVVLAGLSGICFAPICTCQKAVIDEVADPHHKTEAFTWLGTLYGAGLAAGTALAGQLITAAGTRPALAVACASTTTAWLLTTARARTLHTPKPPQSTTAPLTSTARVDS